MNHLDLKTAMQRLGIYPLVVAENLQILAVSARLLKLLGFSAADVRGRSVVRLLGIEFFQDIFVRDRSIWERPFQNYRAWLRTAGGEQRMFQISGYADQDGAGRRRYTMFLMDIHAEALRYKLGTGEFGASVRASRIIRPYISKQLTSRARSAVQAGYDRIPNEKREFTFLFADLVSYTSLAEQSSPDEILEMLNVSIGATSSTVLHSGGFVDKIMGDSIFAVFEKPLNAIIASIEIQKQFGILNLFRLKSEQPEVSLRIGVHSGQCILGSIGSDDFLELTFIGDAVNTAARLERAAEPGSVLVSGHTLKLLEGQVDVIKMVELSLKGKAQALPAGFVNRVHFDGPRGPISLGLDDDIF
jgi:PAS domain S-box-containing protein